MVGLRTTLILFINQSISLFAERKRSKENNNIKHQNKTNAQNTPHSIFH